MEFPESVAAIASRSRFEHLHVTGTQYRGQYGSVYEALAGMGSRQEDISLRLLDCPEKGEPQFSTAITETVGEFAPVTDHDRLVTILDYGVNPVPWLATPTVRGRLSERSPMDFVSPLSTAREIVEGVVHLHQHDLVHGGLDPNSVVFLGASFDDVVQGTPLVDNAGLLHVYRYHFEPADYLDPAYAAPEYYSPEFGTVDHQTDIYQTGAVLYYLVTGRPPFRGSFDAVRADVLRESPPKPSTAGAPSAFDEIITKAMAKEKIKRYETVQYLQGDLARMAANRDFEWVDEE